MLTRSDFTVTTRPLRDVVVTKRGISWDKSMERQRPHQGTYPVIRIPNVQERLQLDDLVYLAGITPK
ncbi:MAG: hypothetical protein KGY78_10310, partial [Anaerolineae bacterium]|nr:hypothetical protein [Anaerolineae bacterium]